MAAAEPIGLSTCRDNPVISDGWVAILGSRPAFECSSGDEEAWVAVSTP